MKLNCFYSDPIDQFEIDFDMTTPYDDDFENSEKSNFKSPNSEEILTMHVPKMHKDPFVGSIRKRKEDPTKSVIKMIESVEKGVELDNSKSELKQIG